MADRSNPAQAAISWTNRTSVQSLTSSSVPFSLPGCKNVPFFVIGDFSGDTKLKFGILLCVMYDITPLVNDLVEPAAGVGDSHLWWRLQPGRVSAVVAGQIEHFSSLLFSQRVEPHVGGGGGGGEKSSERLWRGQFLKRISIILCTDKSPPPRQRAQVGSRKGQPEREPAHQSQVAGRY